MAVDTILSSDLAVNIVYPFLLVFVLIFAILQKTKILGEDKRQIDALISLAIALIFVAFGWATDIVVGMMPYLVIAVVSLLVFLVLWGFVAADKDGLKIEPWVKYGVMIIAAIVVVVALVVATGQWETVWNSLVRNEEMSNIWTNVILLLVIGGAILVVVLSGKKGSGDK